MSESWRPQQNNTRGLELPTDVPPPAAASNPSPLTSEGQVQRRRSRRKDPQPPSKDIMCQRWMWGTCKLRPSKCAYAHGIQGMESTSNFNKTSYCKAWLRSLCKKGDKCRHAHGAHELNFTKTSLSVALTEDQDDSGEAVAPSAGSTENQNVTPAVASSNFEELPIVAGEQMDAIANAAAVVEEPIKVFVGSPNLVRHQHAGTKGISNGKISMQMCVPLSAAEAANVGLVDVVWELEPTRSQDEPLRLIRTHPATLERRAAQLPRTRASVFPPLRSISEIQEHGIKDEL